MKIKSNKALSLILAVTMMLAIVPAFSSFVYAEDVYFPAYNGDGSVDAPFLITTPVELATLAELVNAGDADYNDRCYKLDNDISLSDYGAGYNDAKGWIPIGKTGNTFKGDFNGAGYTITGLYINDDTLSNAGLFGFVQNGTVRNLNIADANIIGGNGVGGVVGCLSGNVASCSVMGTIVGGNGVGGVAGYFYGARATSVTNSNVSGSVTGSGNNVGGVVGLANTGPMASSYVTACYAMCTVEGNSDVGGIAGTLGNNALNGLTVNRCIALNPSISGTAYVGRVAGRRYTGIMTANYALADMSAVGTAAFPVPPETYNVHNNINGEDVSSGSMPVLQYHPFDGTGANLGGYADNPYIINTAEQLAWLATRVNAENTDFNSKYYRLGNDIDLTVYLSLGSPGYNNGEGWVPIGKNTPFLGNFDGAGKSITGLTINPADKANYIGLFGRVKGGTIQNLSVVDASVKGYDRVGGVIGYLDGGSIVNCSAVGIDIDGNMDIGGIVGMMNGYMNNCYTTGVVSGNDNIGGVIGNVGVSVWNDASDTYITSCYSSCNVSGKTAVGGVAGESLSHNTLYDICITNCYAIGTVSGGSYVGGMVGYVGSRTTMENCYATGAVTGNKHVAGVAGYAIKNFSTGHSAVNNCAALNPSVSGESDIGRVANTLYAPGDLSGNRAFSDMTAGNTAFPIPAETYNVHDNLNGADMTMGDAYTALFWSETMKWDTENIWDTADGRLPTLKNISETHITVPAIISIAPFSSSAVVEIENPVIGAALIVAVYDNGRLLSVAAEEISQAKITDGKMEIADIAIPTVEGITVKAMMWSGMGNMRPLCPAMAVQYNGADWVYMP